MFTVYVLYSLKDKHTYVGCTKNVNKRLEEHNSGQVLSTKLRRPLKIVYVDKGIELTPQQRFDRAFNTVFGLEQKLVLDERNEQRDVLSQSQEVAAVFGASIQELEVAGLESGMPYEQVIEVVFAQTSLVSAYTLTSTPLGKVAHALKHRAGYMRGFIHRQTPDDLITRQREVLEHELSDISDSAFGYLPENRPATGVVYDFKQVECAAMLIGLANPFFYRQLVVMGEAIIKGRSRTIDGPISPLQNHLASIRELAIPLELKQTTK